MTLSNNTSAMYNHMVNGTKMGGCVARSLYKWTYSERMEIKEFEEQLALAKKIIYILIIIFIILGNTLVLVATWREKNLHQPNKYFIASLAAFDLLVGLIVVPLRFSDLYIVNQMQPAISVHLQHFVVWIDTTIVTASNYILTIISFDRYLKISKPLHYKSKMTTSRSLKIIFIIFIFSSCFATYIAIPRGGSSGTHSSDSAWKLLKETKTILASIGFFVPTIVMLIMYVLIFIVAHKRQKMQRNGELGHSSQVLNQRAAFRQDLKVIRMLFLVVGLFIFCWSPFIIWWLLVLYYPNFIDNDSTSLSYWFRVRKIETAVLTLPLFNSVCNPIIYAWLDQTYRKAFKHMFQRMICRQS